jgi:predicted nucleic acid-binding protein
MNVLVDTPIWSLALRRHQRLSPVELHHLNRFHELITQRRVQIIGPIRQELLSGIREFAQYERLRERLRSFDDIPLDVRDFEEAADYHNRCSNRGVQGSSVDFLICAVAVRRHFEVYTLDKDFPRYARHLDLMLHTI